jgi:hypothetical protein
MRVPKPDKFVSHILLSERYQNNYGMPPAHACGSSMLVRFDVWLPCIQSEMGTILLYIQESSEDAE